MTSKIADEIRQAILSRIEEPSDTKLARAFGVSRKTIWRLRKTVRKDAIHPPPPERIKPIRVPPATPVPDIPSLEESKLMPDPTPLTEVENAPSVLPESLTYPKPESRVRLKPRPKVVMSTYFAVELLKGENYKDVAYVVTKAASEAGVLFRRLQVLDRPTIGGTAFVRFRADIVNIQAVIDRLTGRSFVAQEGDAFIAHLPRGRKGRYSTSIMCSAARMGMGQMFHGTRLERWIFQYKKPDELSPMENTL